MAAMEIYSAVYATEKQRVIDVFKWAYGSNVLLPPKVDYGFPDFSSQKIRKNIFVNSENSVRDENGPSRVNVKPPLLVVAVNSKRHSANPVHTLQYFPIRVHPPPSGRDLQTPCMWIRFYICPPLSGSPMPA